MRYKKQCEMMVKGDILLVGMGRHGLILEVVDISTHSQWSIFVGREMKLHAICGRIFKMQKERKVVLVVPKVSRI